MAKEQPMNDLPDKDEAAALWRRASPALNRTAEAIDAATLAAWLDRRLDGADQERVERALAADPALLRQALAARAALAGPLDEDQRLAVRASAMMDHPIRSGARGPAWWQGLLAPQRLQWAAVGAALMIAAAAGFSLGDRIGQQLASLDGGGQPGLFGMAGGDPFVGDDDGA
jgi:hypothetical protein